MDVFTKLQIESINIREETERQQIMLTILSTFHLIFQFPLNFL